MTKTAKTVALVACAALLAGTAHGASEVEVFATLPAGEHPEGIAISDGRAYVSTTWGATVATTPSAATELHQVYVLDLSDGSVADVLPVRTDGGVGIAGLAFDGSGRLYAVDTGGRILRIDPSTGDQQTYGTIPDLRPCAVAAPSSCSATTIDLPALPNDLAFDNDGTLYVTDSFQATIFSIPPGGGTAEPWFTDARLESAAIGTNGIRIDREHARMLFGVTGDRSNDALLLSLPLTDEPRADDLVELGRWPGGGLDGIALGASGRIYVTLFASNQLVVLEPDGGVVEVIASPLFDEPATMAFDDASGSILNPSHGFLSPTGRKIVARVHIGEAGARLFQPVVP